jgi:hypothetical protein
VFCIISMMWVHVSPGLSLPSLIHEGRLEIVGDVLGQTLGRISVTTLSFVSGYLLWIKGIERPFLRLMRDRFTSVMVPMLFWSAVFILLAVRKETITGEESSSINQIGATWPELFNSWSGLTGPTANRSLFFLRDLFISAAIVRLASRPLQTYPVPVIAVCGALAATGLGAPILFRPNVLLFMMLGALAAHRGISISRLSRPDVALPLGFLLVGVGFLLPNTGTGRVAILGDFPDIVRRFGVGFLVLSLTASAVRVASADRLARLGRNSFLAFLAHVPVIGFFWAFWTAFVGDEHQLSYLVFYVGSPLVVFLIGLLVGRGLDHMPVLLQVLVRGKAVRRD